MRTVFALQIERCYTVILLGATRYVEREQWGICKAHALRLAEEKYGNVICGIEPARGSRIIHRKTPRNNH